MTQATITPAPPVKPIRTPVNKHITRYDLATGRLLGFGQVGYNSQPEEGQGFLSGHYDLALEWYDGNTVIAREPLTAALSSDEVVLGDVVILAPLPIPCEVIIVNVGLVVVNDGSLEITAESIGNDFRLIVDEPQYIRQSFLFSVIDS